MKKIRLPYVMLAIIVMAGVMPASFAGSDRLIMAIPPKRMIQEQLIHVRLFGPDSVALESDALKQISILNCSSGKVFEMANDFKIGYAPESMMVGIYLYPQAWKNNTICFSIPSLGKVEKRFTSEDISGHSIQLNVEP